MHRQLQSVFDPFRFLRPQANNIRGIFRCEEGNALDEIQCCRDAPWKWLQHMGFCCETQCAKQSGVTRAVTRGLQESDDAGFRRLIPGIDVWDNGFTALLHGVKNMRLHDLSEVRSNHGASFVSLGGDQGHGIGVICAIACVRVNKHIWLNCLK